MGKGKPKIWAREDQDIGKGRPRYRQERDQGMDNEYKPKVQGNPNLLCANVLLLCAFFPN